MKLNTLWIIGHAWNFLADSPDEDPDWSYSIADTGGIVFG